MGLVPPKGGPVTTKGHHSVRSALIKLIIFAAVSVVLTTVVVTTLLDLQTNPSASYKAVFSDAAGLQSSDIVAIAGVEVGKVSGVSLNSRHQAVVSFSINSNQHLTTTTIAQINFQNLIGQRFLNLRPGKTPGQKLKPGGTIPVAHTIPGLDLTTLFNGFQPLFNVLSPSSINQLTGSIIDVFQGEGGNVGNLVNQIGSLTQNLVGRQQVIDQVLGNLTPLVNTVAGHDQQLGQLIDSFDTLVQGLAGERGQINNALTSVSGLTSNLSNVLGNSQPSLNQDLSGLTTTTGVLASDQQQFSSALHYLPGMLNVLVKASSTGDYLNVYICNLTVSTNGPISVRLVPNFTAILPVPTGTVGGVTSAGPEPVQHTQACT